MIDSKLKGSNLRLIKAKCLYKLNEYPRCIEELQKILVDPS